MAPSQRFTGRKLTAAVVLLLALAAAGAGAFLAASSDSTAQPATGSGGRVATQSPKGRPLGATPSRSLVRFSLVLRLHQARLHRFLTGLYDPHSHFYHRFIGARTFGRRFGVRDRELGMLRRSLRQAGIKVVEQYPQRTSLDVIAPAGVVDHLFGVRLMDYLGPGGRRFHSPLSAPMVPGRLRHTVTGVAGLSGRYLPHPEDVPASGVTPAMGALAYGITPLYARGIRGQGEKVAVIEAWKFSQFDLDQFNQQFNLPSFTPQSAFPPQDGPATDESADGEGEAELDLELIHEIAPQAQIVDYNAPAITGLGADTLGDVVDKIVADGQVSIVSDSLGFCELTWPTGDIRRDEQAIEAAVAHGISIFKSTGDAGAYQCARFNSNDQRLSVEWPASSPGVVAVGGTALSVGVTGGYAGETAWVGTLTQSGSGGGVSAVFPRPSWQRAPGVLNRFSNGKREIPDVSANADPNSGWAVYTGGSLAPVGGTSASAPFWAGAMALIDQYARQHGVRRLGFVDPMLYAIASTPQPAPPFHDITVGNDRYYPSTVGWDFATGLGSPDVNALAQDVVRYLKSH